VDADDVLDVFDRGEPLTTPEVAVALDISQRAAWVYLSELAEDGRLERQPGSDLQMDTWSLSGADEGDDAAES
jgi:DNA-binding IclR family transcriptional regulator